MATATIKVKGMTCGHCQMAVTKALKAVPGVSDAQVSLMQHQATVSYDEGKTSLDELKKAVVEAGYEAE